MDRNGLVIVLMFLFMIVFGRSDAFNYRKLVTVSPPDRSSNSNQDSSLSSPPPDDKKQNLSPESTKSKDSQNKSESDIDKKKLEKAKSREENQTKTFDRKSCKGNQICNDREKTMIACIQDFENGFDKLTLLVQNERDVELKGNITSMNKLLTPFEIPAHGTKKVNITLSGDKNTKIILNAGNGDCELQISQPKTPPINPPSKSKNPENTSSPTNTPIKPEKVNDPKKSKEVNDPSKDKITDSPNPKETDDTKKPTNVDDDKKPKVDDPPKSKEVNDPPKSKEVNDTLEPKDENDPSHKPTTISGNKFLDQLTFYSKQVTPIYGAYFAFLVALIIGASWALCSFRKRRTDNKVAYQELEMGLPETSNAVNEETAEGWDQDWDDDDWDEDKAIRAPGGGIQNKSISSNGLTSRASKKDGWDDDWDD